MIDEPRAMIRDLTALLGRPLRILVVDDNPGVLAAMKGLLTALGQIPVPVDHGAMALEALESQHFDLVISDCMIPGMSGLELLRQIQAVAPYVPVILLTGRTDLELAVQALRYGAIDFITKPARIEELSAAIERAGLLVAREHELWTLEEDRCRAENAVREAAERFETLLQASKDAIVAIGRDERIQFANPAAEELFQRGGDELIGATPGLLMPSASAEIQQHLNETFRDPAECLAGRTILLPAQRSDGHPLETEIALSAAGHGEKRMVLAIIRDISARRKAEDEARQAREEAVQAARSRMRILSAVSTFFISLGRDGRVTEWTPAAERIFGLRRDQAIDRSFRELPLEWDWQVVEAALTRCEVEPRAEVDTLRLARAGEADRFLRLTVETLRDEHQPGLIVMGDDVTERLALERNLVQAQKLESIGQLAAGIAHEINTPTQYVGDNTRFLKDSFDDLTGLLAGYSELLAAARAGSVPSELLERIEAQEEEIDLEFLLEEIPLAVEQSLEGVERVAKIVRAMKEFSHPGSEEKQPIDLNRAIESTVTVARNEWKYVAELVCDFAADLPLVPCLPGELNQVILNMVVNAAHAIGAKVGEGGEKGTITVSTRRCDEGVEIRIADTGTGMPAAVLSKIFDPFFTTKGVGKGTGQGLAIARSVIVDKHRGAVEVETAEGEGTTFIIRLPLGVEPAAGLTDG